MFKLTDRKEIENVLDNEYDAAKDSNPDVDYDSPFDKRGGLKKLPITSQDIF